MDKVYLKYKESLMNSQRLMDELAIDHEGDSLGMGIIRKEMDLNNDEKQYLLAVERGDVPSTRNFLNNLSVNGININCVDPLGRTALQVAIENENIEMIELLLSFNVEVGDALLHAINEENVEAVELILNHEVNTKGEEALHQLYPSSSFSPDITPIILAGHRDNYEIIKILLDRGFRIPKPHDVRCSCKDCLTESEDDSLRHSRSRINAYKALVSPSLIALSSKDPILTSFELSRELKRLSKMENEFKVDYEKLATRCQDFAVDLLEQTRGSRELQIILNHDTSSAGTDEQGAEKTKLSRLKLAIKYKQKRFVSHPNCQQLLASLWYEGLPGFRRRNIVSKLMITQTIGIMFPVMSLIYLIAPKCSIGELIRKPFIKFIVHSASYLTFLFLLILVSQRVEILSENDSGNHDDKVKRELRGAPATTIEWMILAYVAGLMWAEIKQLWDDGAKEYIHDMWNILDFVTNSLYIATFTLRLLAYLQVQEERRNNDPAAQKQRKAWDAYDPNLISEALFAAANIFSSLKLIYIFTVNPHLGPLQISLGRMIMDIMKFGCVYFLVLFSFACGLNHLYWYYATVHADECAADSTSSSCDRKFRSFANLFDILQTLYWSVYGLVDLEHAELQPKFNHQFTEFVGKLTFGTYSWIAFIVLLNMLIAMMSNSYQMIYVSTCGCCCCGMGHLQMQLGLVLKDEQNLGIAEPCLFEILQTLYWSVFGLVDLDHAELRPKFNHEYTELVGKLMFGVYSWIALVVLLNMLIAMMSNSYQIIYSQADEEWKFARSKLWISYFEDSGTLPAPFNIIPSPKTFYYILVWFKNKLCACSKKQKRNRWQSIKKIVKKINEREIKYQAVMRDLIKRYIMQKQRGPQRGEGVTEDDVNELKQDISSFRFELLEILRSNGMKTPNPNQPKPTNRRLSRKRSQMSLDRLKRSLSMEPLHELSTSASAANQTWKSSSFKRDTLSVDMAISQTPVHVPSVEVTSSRIIAETIPEEIERKRRESMKPAPGEFCEFVVSADEIKIETHLASPLDEDENHGRLTGLEDKVHLRDDRPNSTESVMSAHRKDEGLGESFDQYSEVSDSLSRNGNLNTDTVTHVDDGMQPVTLSPSDSPSHSPARLGPSASEVLATICSSKRVTFM